MELDIGGGNKYRVLLAPALVLNDADLNRVRHNAVLAHGLATQAIRAHGGAGINVGFADNMEAAVPIDSTAAHVQAAETATREMNAPFITVMLEGAYTDTYLEAAGGEAQHIVVNHRPRSSLLLFSRLMGEKSGGEHFVASES